MIAISKEYLGTEFNLLQHDRDGHLMWRNQIPSDFLVFGNSNTGISVSPAFKIFNMPYPDIIPQQFRKAMDVCGVTGQKIPWHNVMPRDQYIRSLEGGLSTLWDLLYKLGDSSYLQTYIKINQFLQRMDRAKIDISKLENFIQNEKNPSVLSTLVSFRSKNDGFAQRVKYDICRTVTGRLTVNAGPRILTLPAMCRDMIKSRFENGKIYEIDFKSLEPRIALSLAGKEVPFDVYEEISRNLFEEKLERSLVKIAVLCALYGVSTKKLDKMLDGKFSAIDVIKKIKKYFCYDDIVYDLRQQYETKNYISNTFGRPVRCDNSQKNILYSNFIQSTATDAALLGFEKLMNHLSSFTQKAIPVFLIHDAIIVDIEDDEMLEQIPNFIELDKFGKLYFDASRVS